MPSLRPSRRRRPGRIERRGRNCRRQSLRCTLSCTYDAVPRRLQRNSTVPATVVLARAARGAGAFVIEARTTLYAHSSRGPCGCLQHDGRHCEERCRIRLLVGRHRTPSRQIGMALSSLDALVYAYGLGVNESAKRTTFVCWQDIRLGAVILQNSTACVILR